jgi:phenolic acid decarboxylase
MKYFYFIATVLIACNNPKNDEFKDILPKDLIGKTIEYTYGESIYHVILDTDSTMHWEAVAGDEKGAREKETYFMESVGHNKIFISWDEANGTGVSQILDFNEGKVYNHLLQDRKLQNGHGTIRILE